MAATFTHPECVALNRQGIVSDRQRKSLLMDSAFLVFGGLVMLAVAIWLVVAGGSWLSAAMIGGVGVMILFGTKDTLALYRDPKPSITVKRGLVQPFERIPINKGGTVVIGQEKLYLRREQIREIRFGYNYEIFVAMPYGRPISADPIDLR
jgi:hypothetical protein